MNKQIDFKMIEFKTYCRKQGIEITPIQEEIVKLWTQGKVGIWTRRSGQTSIAKLFIKFIEYRTSEEKTK